MSLLSQTETNESTDRSRPAASEGGRDPPSLLGRLLYGGVMIFTGVNHFLNGDEMVPYAESKGVPMAEKVVPFSGGMLIFGGLGIALWRLPLLAAGAVASFLAATTPLMHDFWAVDEEQKQSEMNNFLKNAALLGAALAFLRRASRQ